MVAYLIPNKLSSFQRIPKKEKNIFSENLNELFDYGALAFGFKGEDIYIGEVSKAKPGEINMVLRKMTHNEVLHYSILNAGASIDIISELKYQAFEHKEILRKKKIEKREEIRRRLMPLVFPCHSAPAQQAVPQLYDM